MPGTLRQDIAIKIARRLVQWTFEKFTNLEHESSFLDTFTYIRCIHKYYMHLLFSHVLIIMKVVGAQPEDSNLSR